VLRFNLVKAIIVLTDRSKMVINIPVAKLECVKYQWFPLRDCEFKKYSKCEVFKEKESTQQSTLQKCAFSVSYELN